MARELGPTEWVTPKGKVVTFSYVHIWETNDDDKYTIAILIPKTETGIMKQIKACIDAAKEIGIKSKWNGSLPPKNRLKIPVKDGDERFEEDEEKYAAYEGCYYLNCSSTNKPGIVNAKGKEIKDPADVYSGCVGRVSLNFWPYNAENGKSVGVAAFLNNVQKMDDGERIGGGGKRSAAVDFGVESDFDEEDDDYAPPKKVVKKKRPVEDDEDDDYTPPKKKRKPVVEEDDEDDEPVRKPVKKKRPPVEDDDDGDYAPPKKKRKIVEDDDDLLY